MGSLSEPLPIGPPERITAGHDLEEFDCGESSLNQWLRSRALANEDSGASRTYVTSSGKRVVGYYSLATGAVARDLGTGRVRRNAPDPVPVIVLARLAVDRRFQHRGIGKDLLRDAVLRSLQAAEIASVRAILVHTLSPAAKAFYQGFGFMPSPTDDGMLMIPTAQARKALKG
ncbi:MAG TPA: GNAT family N-acetyltransferase [Terriglobales bacterium]|jgi:ribosomal protein S18 acetylase RimI-like enzyme